MELEAKWKFKKKWVENYWNVINDFLEICGDIKDINVRNQLILNRKFRASSLLFDIFTKVNDILVNFQKTILSRICFFFSSVSGLSVFECKNYFRKLVCLRTLLLKLKYVLEHLQQRRVNKDLYTSSKSEIYHIEKKHILKERYIKR